MFSMVKKSNKSNPDWIWPSCVPVFTIFGHFVATIGARFLSSRFEHFLGTVDPQTRVPKSSQWIELQSYKFLASLENSWNLSNFLSVKFQKPEFSWLDSYKKISFWNF